MADDFDFLEGIGSERGSFGGGSPLSNVFEKNGTILIEALQKTLDQSVPDAETGKLYQSIAFDINIVGKVWRFSISMEDYWQWVNDGRKPGKKPPLKYIVDWIDSKPSVKAQIKSGKGLIKKRIERKRKERTARKKRKMSTITDIKASKEVLGAAFGIMNKIGKKGIQPTHFVSKNINSEVIQKLKDEIASVTSKKIKISVKQLMESINGDNN